MTDRALPGIGQPTRLRSGMLAQRPRPPFTSQTVQPHKELCSVLTHRGVNKPLAFRSETGILSVSKDAGPAVKPMKSRILRLAQDAI